MVFRPRRLRLLAVLTIRLAILDGRTSLPLIVWPILLPPATINANLWAVSGTFEGMDKFDVDLAISMMDLDVWSRVMLKFGGNSDWACWCHLTA